MSQEKAKFVLETLSSAFGISEDVPWNRAHRETFPTLAQAEEARNIDLTEMQERCGPNAWDSHRRIVPTIDTQIVYHLACSGVLGGEPCPNWSEAVIALDWLAGEPCPMAPPPDGWVSTYQCAACAEQEREKMEAFYNQ